MTLLNDELLDDYESDELVPNEDSDEDELLELEDENPQAPKQQPNVVAQLKTQITELQGSVADYKKRLGNATEQLGKRLKERDDEVDGWLAKINPWHEAEMLKAHNTGFEEGVRSVEDRLLKQLGVEERAMYLEEIRRNRPAPSPHTVEQLDTRRQPRPSGANEDINDLVQEFIEQGVPLDQLEQTSAKAVVASGTRWLKSQVAKPDEPDISSTRQREENGQARVSSGTGQPQRMTKSGAQKRLEQVELELRRLKGKSHVQEKATHLLEERKRLRRGLGIAN